MKVIKPNNLSQLDGSFKRASTATYIDGGVLKYAAVDEPRFQDGVLLLEKRGVNKIINSEVFTGSNWIQDGCSMDGNAEVGPNGVGLTAEAMYETSANVQHSLYSVGADMKTFSIFVKPNGVRYVSLWGYAGGLVLGRTFDLQEATLGSAWVAGTPVSSKIETLINGWYRLSIEHSTNFNISGISLLQTNASGAEAYIGNPNNGVFLFGAMGGDVISSYIPTTTTAVTREPDCVAGNFTRASTATYIDNGVLKYAAVNEPRFQDGVLLVEDAATNLLTYSSDFLAFWGTDGVSTLLPNAGTAPDGSMAATQHRRGAGTYLYRVLTAEQQNARSFSIFCKALTGGTRVALTLYRGFPTTVGGGTFDIVAGSVVSGSGAVESLGGGWFRVSVEPITDGPITQFDWTLVDAAGSVYGAGEGPLIFGAQLSNELSSYIPTTTTVVTRAADIELPSIAYSNATDSTPLWSSATTYSAGQKVRYLSKIYESLVGSNLNNIPSNTPLSWLDLGADNIHAMIDGIVNTPTKRTENLRVILRPGQFDSLALIDMNATISTASVYDSNTYELIYSNKAGLTGAEVFDWYQYFFYSPTTERSQYVLTGIPTNPNVIVAIDLNVASTEEVSVGQLTIGLSEDLGGTQYGARAGIVDYSKKSTDEFGTITFVERPYSKKLEAEIYFANSQLNRIHKYLTSIRATPVVWIASDDPTFEEAMVIYGFYKDFSTTIAYPSHSLCNLQIEGLT